MISKLKYPITLEEAEQIVTEGIFKLDPKELLKNTLRFMGWSYSEYSMIIGKPRDYINNRINNRYSKPIRYSDIVTLKLVILKYFPEVNFNSFMIEVLLSVGRLGLSPSSLLRKHEKELQEKNITINLLNKRIKEYIA